MGQGHLDLKPGVLITSFYALFDADNLCVFHLMYDTHPHIPMEEGLVYQTDRDARRLA